MTNSRGECKSMRLATALEVTQNLFPRYVPGPDPGLFYAIFLSVRLVRFKQLVALRPRVVNTESDSAMAGKLDARRSQCSKITLTNEEIVPLSPSCVSIVCRDGCQILFWNQMEAVGSS